MATKTLSYDHPAYLVPHIINTQTTAGANGVSGKHAAYTALQIKACLTTPNIASTAAGSQPLLFTKSGTATATTTLTVLTSGSVTPIANALATSISMAQGDVAWVTHGTDATASLSCTIECNLVPGAALTA